MTERPTPPAADSRRIGPIAWMAHNPIAANLLMVLLLAGGVWTAMTMHKEVFPQFQLDMVEVNVTYPGASPEEVEQGILLPIEEAAQGVRGIKEITSTAREGSGSVRFELVSRAARMKVYQDVDQAVNSIRTFPDEIEEPEVRLQARQYDVMEIGLYGEVDVWSLRKLAERLRDHLVSHEAITQVELENVPDYVMHVEIPQAALRRHHMTLGDVAGIIEESSSDIPAGAVQTSGGEILLRMKERKQWAEEFGEIPVAASQVGTPLTLAHLARIGDGFEEGSLHSRFNGHRSVEIGVYRSGSQSPLEIASAVESVLADFGETLPPRVHYRVDSNRAKHYQQRLSLLLENGAIAVLIVLFILAAFLEYRLAFWVMMGMTISFVGGIMFLPSLGVSLNMISMFAFLVVLGIVVDDAIVVGENIHEHRQRGKNFLDAAIDGAREMASPVTFSILTNIVAFVPLLFMPGVMGEFWWPLPAVVITILAVSLLEAFFILPAHLGHSSEKKATSAGRRLHEWQQSFSGGFNRFVNRFYRRFLDFCLRNRYITLSLALALLLVVGGYGYSGHMGMIMMPEVSADEIEAGVSLPVGTTPDQAAAVAERITESTQRMYARHDLGRVAEGIKTNVRGQDFIDVEIVMKPAAERDMTAAEVISLWRKEIGDIEGVDQITFEAERGPGGYRDDISVDLSHSRIAVLEEATRALSGRVKRLKATRDVHDNYSKGKSRFNFRLLPEGRSLGLTSADVGSQLRNAFHGAEAMRQLRGTNEVEVRVKLPKEQRERLATLEDFVLHTPDGVEVPFLEVARLERGQAFTSINRRDGRRVVNVGMDVEPKRATARVLRSIKGDVLPGLRAEYPGITWSFQGSQAQMRESTQALWGGFGLAMGVVYALLAVAFGSYIQPLIVMAAIPFGIVGAVIGHILLGYQLSLISMMGVIALSGVVVNDSLIMIHYANRSRGEGSAYTAIHQAGLRRFRPIILTTLTTFGGLTPIILETSRQAAYLIPMAVSLGFGIVFATSIILVIVPCLYMVLEDVSRLVRGGSEAG